MPRKYFDRVFLDEYEREPGPADTLPYADLVGLTSGGRDILIGLARDHASLCQAIRDENPELAQANAVVDTHQAMTNAKLKALKEDTEALGEGEDEKRQALLARRAKLIEEHFDLRAKRLEGQAFASEALDLRFSLASIRYQKQRVAVVIKRLGGDWGLLDADLERTEGEGKALAKLPPEWPKLGDPSDPMPSIHARLKVLDSLSETMLKRLFDATNRALEGGASGLTESEAGN